jgi:phytoene dehydrogenase-like protein
VSTALDAIVVGSGPNGLAAAITIARAGRSVRVYEAETTVGGGTRSAELMEPGCVHDLCATVFALALASPVFKELPLADYGLEFVQPAAPFAHPLDDGSAISVERSVEITAASLGATDGRAYRRLVSSFVDRADRLLETLLGPPLISLRHPVLMASFAQAALASAIGLARRRFETDRARALFAGAAAHSMVPLDMRGTAGYGLSLMVVAHSVGWPVVRGGAQRFGDALAEHLRSLGGEIVVGQRVTSLSQLPASRAVVCDVTPKQFLRLAGDRLPAPYRRRLERYRYGPAAFKVDWVLNAPVPWRADECRRAGTVHVGGSLAEIARGERDAWLGRVSDRPYVLVVQPSRFDESRAAPGREVLWAYCHVPNGATADMTDVIERQIERFAPGFRDCIEMRHTTSPADMERRNANLVGGDIAGGAGDLRQIFSRPVLSLNPYATPIDGVYLCSSSTPPGIGYTACVGTTQRGQR